MSTEKRINKVKKLTKDYGEPSINPMDYKNSLIWYLNYHNINSTDKDKRQWAEKYLRENYPGKRIPNLHDREFRTLGVLARLVQIESYIDEPEEKTIESECLRILSSKKEEKVINKEPSSERLEKIQKTNETNISNFLGEFEGIVDDFIVTGVAPSVQGLISSMGVNNRMISAIVEYAKKNIAYYEMVLEDKDALGYYNISKPTIRKVMGLYETLLTRLTQTKKVVQKAPRKQKEKPAGVIAQKMKYLIQSDELGIRSVPAANIVGATEAVLFRTDHRSLQYYVAVEGQTLTIRGTTILNFDTEKSYWKKIRKPETLKENLCGKGKLDTRRFLKSVAGEEHKVSGRTSEHTLIINTFR